jgi:hypothetical protein
MAAAIGEIRAARDRAGRSGPFAMGGMTRIYVGHADWETGPCITGQPGAVAEAVSEEAAIGVTHLQVKFPARSALELVDQMGAFHTEVVPQLS